MCECGGRVREYSGVSKFKINIIKDQNFMAGGFPRHLRGRGQHVSKFILFFLVVEIQRQRKNFSYIIIKIIILLLFYLKKICEKYEIPRPSAT